MIANIKAWLYGIGLSIAALALAFMYARGASNAKDEIRLEDYENAEDLRRRNSVGLADELHKHDNSGWRD